MVPTEDFGVKVSGSAGEYKFFRIFGLVNTGEFTPFGTRAFFSASTASNDNPFNNYGRVRKKQFNARVWQPIGDNGDFVSRSEEHTSELQSLMRISYAVFCLKKTMNRRQGRATTARQTTHRYPRH